MCTSYTVSDNFTSAKGAYLHLSEVQFRDTCNSFLSNDRQLPIEFITI